MLRSSLFLLAILAFGIDAAAQNSPRTFDNFDRSQGVSVYVPPQPEIEKPAKRVKRNGRWVVVTDDKLVKKTASTRAASVSDGLATREGSYNPAGTRLAMGSSSHLKGFTTGNPMHDQYIVDSSRRYR